MPIYFIFHFLFFFPAELWMLMLRQKQDFIGTASGSKMKRPQEAFCYQIPLILPVVTFITAEGMLPKSDFTSESARIRHWSCNRRKTVGRRQNSIQVMACERGKRLREKENGFVLLPKSSPKLLDRWGRWGQPHSPAPLFLTITFRSSFPATWGNGKGSQQSTAKPAPWFLPAPSSSIQLARNCSQTAAEQVACRCLLPEHLPTAQLLFFFDPLSALWLCVAVWRTRF